MRDYIFQESEERKLSTETTEKNVEFGKEKKWIGVIFCPCFQEKHHPVGIKENDGTR